MTEHADAAGVIAGALPGEPEKVIAVLEGLMAHGLLRESPADFTGLPEGAVLLHDLRIIEYLDADSGEGKTRLRHADGITYSAIFALLGIANAEITRLWIDAKREMDS